MRVSSLLRLPLLIALGWLCGLAACVGPREQIAESPPLDSDSGPATEAMAAEQGGAKEQAEQDDPGATGQDPDIDQVDGDTQDEGEESSLDTVQVAVADRVRDAATWLDSRLGNDRFLEEQNQSTVTLRTEFLVEDREDVEVSARIKARLVLPRTEERAHMAFSGYDDEDQALERERFPESVEANDGTDLGLQYFLKATQQNNIRGEVGLRFNDFTPNPYVGARWRHTAPLNDWVLRAQQRLRFYVEEHWESLSTVDFERLISEDYFFRSTTTGSWFEVESGFFYGQYFSLFQWFDSGYLLTYEWNNSFRTQNEGQLDETQLRLRYSRRMLRDWILFEVAPQISWRERIDYQPAAGILFRLEFLFGAPVIPFNSPLHLSEHDRDQGLDRDWH